MFFTRSAPCAAVLALAFAATTLPAPAATPLAVQLGVQFPTHESARNAGGSTQTDLGVTYDLLSAPVVPVQAMLQVDDAFGTHAGGRLNVLSAGAAARLTTPLYAGAGVSVYNVNARPGYAGATNVSSTGIGENFFVGDRFLTLPAGIDFSLQATYEQIPQFGGIDASSLGVGLRVHL
jgi:hypothetical protein